MDFVYAPPPPPPSAKKSGNNNNNRGNLDKKNPNSKNKLSTVHGLENESKLIQQNLNYLGDLPTYLPNSSTNVAEYKEGVSEDEEVVLKQHYEESQTKSKEPVFISGTNIALETEEDINKWIEERKKKWPSRRNVDEKEKTRQAQATNPTISKKRTNESNGTQNKKPKSTCKFYQNNKRCKFGNKCKNLHELTSTTGENSSQNTKTINNIRVVVPQRFKNEMYIKEKDSNSHPLLFKMLVQKDHFENENSKVLEFLEFLNKKGLIDHDVTI